VDARGRIYVGENGFNSAGARSFAARILVFDGSGLLARVIGPMELTGQPDRQELGLSGIAIDQRRGLLYAIRPGTREILRFTLDGASEGSIALPPHVPISPGDFMTPYDLAPASDGKILLPNGRDNSIAIYDPASGQWTSFGTKGSGPAQFSSPVAVSVAPDGSIYVADYGNPRVSKFDRHWRYLYEIRHRRSGAPEESCPGAVASTADGGVVVAYNSYLAAFDPRGRMLWEWDAPGDQPLVGLSWVNDVLSRSGGIAVSPDGAVYVSGARSLGNYDSASELMRLARDIRPIPERIAITGTQQFSGAGRGQFNHPCGVAADRSGNIFIGEFNNHRLQKFDRSGRFLLQFGVTRVKSWGEWKFGVKDDREWEFGVKDDLQWPVGVAVDAARDAVYVADWAHGLIRQFTLKGDKVRDLGEGIKPWGVAVDEQGRIYVSDPQVKGVRILGAEGAAQGVLGPEQGIEFQRPGMLAVHAGRAYVTDRESNEVVVIDLVGAKEVLRFGNDALLHPDGIAVDGSGDIWVADTSHHRVAHFGPDGTLTGSFGSRGTQPGQFIWPKGICIDAAGRVIVTDWGNDRVQVFAPQDTTRPVLVWGSFSTQNATRGLDVATALSTDLGLLIGQGVVTASGVAIRTFGEKRRESAERWQTRTDFAGVVDAVVADGKIENLEGSPWPGETRQYSLRIYNPDGTLSAEYPAPLKPPQGWRYEAWLTTDDVKPQMALHRGRLLLTDTDAKEVLVCDTKGRVHSTFGKGILSLPGGIAVGPDARIYVTDTPKHRVLIFDQSGRRLRSFGTPGVQPHNLLFPTALAFARDGSLLVLDLGNLRVKCFDRRGRFLSTSPVLQTTGLNHVSTGHDGRIYVSNRSQLWTLQERRRR
jgi:DNA-binding beta-propeller fold protein YncE